MKASDLKLFNIIHYPPRDSYYLVIAKPQMKGICSGWVDSAVYIDLKSLKLYVRDASLFPKFKKASVADWIFSTFNPTQISSIKRFIRRL